MSRDKHNIKSAEIKVNRNCPPEQEINILLLGQTGVGKTTFINALANYLTYNSLDDAVQNEVQVVISSAITHSDPETFDSKIIKISNGKGVDETTVDNGQSCTQHCRTFVFPLGDRNLRIIDTPGMGDTRGSEQDQKNLFEILSYVSQYEHLNAICILLRPNEERLTVAFRLCTRQILHYLQANAAENLIFIFTNARATFFLPGSSKKNLEFLLKEYNEKNEFEIPFSKENTFLIDNEPFRYLALHKENIAFNTEEVDAYTKSWNHAVKEYERLLIYMSNRSLHAIGNVLSINGAEQLIKRTARPLAETLRLILRNIQLAKNLKEDLTNNPKKKIYEIPLIVAQINPLTHPRLVCTSEKCMHITNRENQTSVDYVNVCQEESYLNGVTQEAISDSRIAKCEIIVSEKGVCEKCKCDWKEHMNITYEYYTFQPPDASNKKNDKNTKKLSIGDVEKRIEDLQHEREHIEKNYMKLSEFLLVNVICSSNEDFSEYLRIFINEEKIKKTRDDSCVGIIDDLEEIRRNYTDNMKLLKEKITQKEGSAKSKTTIENEEVFIIVGTLYRLPINGRSIREQIDSLTMMEGRAVKTREIRIKLPKNAASSQIMRKFVYTKTPNESSTF